MPQYLRDYCVYYAGPAKTPEGYASGSFGPTTAGRMDSYVDLFQSNGGSFVMLAKGNRSKAVTDACKEHGGFYLGSIGGPAARLAKDCITKVEVLEYPELGMEAVWKIEVRRLPRVHRRRRQGQRLLHRSLETRRLEDPLTSCGGCICQLEVRVYRLYAFAGEQRRLSSIALRPPP